MNLPVRETVSAARCERSARFEDFAVLDARRVERYPDAGGGALGLDLRTRRLSSFPAHDETVPHGNSVRVYPLSSLDQMQQRALVPAEVQLVERLPPTASPQRLDARVASGGFDHVCQIDDLVEVTHVDRGVGVAGHRREHFFRELRHRDPERGSSGAGVQQVRERGLHVGDIDTGVARNFDELATIPVAVPVVQESRESRRVLIRPVGAGRATPRCRPPVPSVLSPSR